MAHLTSVSSPESNEAGIGQALQLLRHTAWSAPVQTGQHHQHLLQQELHGGIAKLGDMCCKGLQHCQLNLQGTAYTFSESAEYMIDVVPTCLLNFRYEKSVEMRPAACRKACYLLKRIHTQHEGTDTQSWVACLQRACPLNNLLILVSGCSKANTCRTDVQSLHLLLMHMLCNK